MSKNINAALYVRVSTEEQAKEGFSIAAQIGEIEAYADRNNMDIVERYMDEGVSGKSISGRPEMKRLLKDLNSQRFNAVIVYKIDRISRKSKDALEIAERCQEANVSLISINEDFDIASPVGKMLFQMMSNFAEFERNSIVQRLKMGMMQRAKQGYHNGGIVLGYDNVNKMLVVNEEEAHVVRLIFDYAEQELGYKAIVNRINGMGYKTKRGVEFSINTVKTILDNPLYIGKIRFNLHENWKEKHRKGRNKHPILVDGKHEALISTEQWERVQKIRKKRSHKPAQSHTPFILSGIIRCPECGYGMVPGRSTGHKGKKYRYYVCGKFHTKGSHACHANSMRAEIAEQHVFNELKRIVSNPYVLQELIGSVNKKRSQAKSPITDEINIVRSKLKKVTQRIDNISDKLIDRPSLVSILEPKLIKLEDEKKEFQNRLESLNTKLDECDTTPIDENALYNLLSNFEKVLLDADPEEQKALLRLIIKDIQVTKEAPRGIGRQIKRINLHFDFTLEGLEAQSLELMNAVGMDFIEPVEPWMLEINNGKGISDMMDSLNILPLKDVRFIPVNLECPVNLLN